MPHGTESLSRCFHAVWDLDLVHADHLGIWSLMKFKLMLTIGKGLQCAMTALLQALMLPLCVMDNRAEHAVRVVTLFPHRCCARPSTTRPTRAAKRAATAETMDAPLIAAVGILPDLLQPFKAIAGALP